MGSGDLKRSGKLQAIADIGLAGTKVKLNFHPNTADQHRRIGAYSQPQQVFNLSLGNQNIQLDLMTRRFAYSNHEAIGHQGGTRDRRTYGFQVGVSIRAIDNGMKFSVKRNPMPASCNLKVRGLSLSVHYNVIERPCIVSK